MTVYQWYREEELYLDDLHRSCVELSNIYQKLYLENLRQQTRYRIPAIVLSSLSGVASFGTQTFPEDARIWVSISVGIVNIIISIMNTIEAYLNLGEKIAKSRNAAIVFKKIADDITCELSIPIKDRETNGIIFLRECFVRYQQTLEASPSITNTYNENNNDDDNTNLNTSSTLNRSMSIMGINNMNNMNNMNKVKVIGALKYDISAIVSRRYRTIYADTSVKNEHFMSPLSPSSSSVFTSSPISPPSPKVDTKTATNNRFSSVVKMLLPLPANRSLSAFLSAGQPEARSYKPKATPYIASDSVNLRSPTEIGFARSSFNLLCNSDTGSPLNTHSLCFMQSAAKSLNAISKPTAC